MSKTSGMGRSIPGTSVDMNLSENLIEFRGEMWDAATDYWFGIHQIDIDWQTNADLTGVEETTFSSNGDLDTLLNLDIPNRRLEVGATSPSNNPVTRYTSGTLREAQTFPYTAGWGVSHIKTTFWGPDVYNNDPSPGPVRNQHGVLLRWQEIGGFKTAVVVWHDIVFASPHVINIGVWRGDGVTFDNRQGGATMTALPDFWNWTGATRTSGVVTINTVTPDPAARPVIVGDRIHIVDTAGTSFDCDILVTSVTSSSITGTQAWPPSPVDASVVTSGTASRVFPYDIEVIVEGTYVKVRACHTGDPMPAWSLLGTDTRVIAYDLESETAARRAAIPTPRGTGRIGCVSSHVGWDPIVKGRYGTFYGSNSTTDDILDVAQVIELETAQAITLTGGSSTPATVTPAVIATTAALPASTENIGARPAAAATVAALPASTRQVGATATPAVAATTTAAPAATPLAGTGGTAAPAVTATAVTAPLSGRNIGAGPAATATTVAAPAAASQAGATTNPAVAATTTALPAAGAAGSSPATLLPAVITATSSAPQATAASGTLASPAVAATSAALAATAENVAAGPAVTATAATAPAAVKQTGATVLPTVVGGVGALPAPTLLAGGGVTVAPAATAMMVAAPAAAVGATVGALVIARAFATPQAAPAVAAGPVVVARAFLLPASTEATAAGPAAVAATAALAQSLEEIGAGPGPLPVVAGLPPATLLAGGGATVTPAAVGTLLAAPQPGAAVRAEAAVIARQAALGAPSTALGIVAAPAAVAAVVAVPAAARLTAWRVTATPLALTVAMGTPLILLPGTIWPIILGVTEAALSWDAGEAHAAGTFAASEAEGAGQ
jgi:hypothetical protein